MVQDRIVILNFGSQYTHLIAKNIRRFNVYAEIWPHDTSADRLKDPSIKGIILSGGPRSVNSLDALDCDQAIYTLNKPILGICYGMQLMAKHFSGDVQTKQREYGHATITIESDALFEELPSELSVWMSHGDHIGRLPESFIGLARSRTMIAAMKHQTNPFYGLQFHPEVKHTEQGEALLRNFVLNICDATATWTMKHLVKKRIDDIKARVQNERVVLGLSGGVDSSVAAVLIDQAIHDQLICVFVDHGFLRKDEAKQVMKTFTDYFSINVIKVDAKERFLTALKGITDPEQKRKIIGKTFIDVFKETTQTLGTFKFLAQGTLYTDMIESGQGVANTIKSHHNVGGLPKELGFELLEPLNDLYKDEVRELGHELKIPKVIVERPPFPGPGLAIRILGEVTEDKLALVRESDAILKEEIVRMALEENVWQYFTVLTPMKTVGVMGDNRTYDYTLAVRAVTSIDGMTADWAKLPYPLLEAVSRRIVNEITGINRVVYDITSKPPATIEWE